MTRRIFHRHRVFNLPVGKYPMQKAISESLDGMFNPGAFDQVYTNSNYAHRIAFKPSKRGSGNACNLVTRVTFAISSAIILHRHQHLANRAFQPYKNRARNNGVANVQFGQMRNSFNQFDVRVIDPVTSVNLEFELER